MGWWSGSSRKAERLRQLGPKGSLGVAEAWLTLAWVDVVTSSLPYDLWRGWLRLESSPRDRVAVGDVRGLATWVEIAIRHYPRPLSCLPRALALRTMLSRRGLSARLRIGATRNAETILAHAWVEHDGHVLDDAPDVAVRYVPLERWTS
jgi:hypothetical protein